MDRLKAALGVQGSKTEADVSWDPVTHGGGAQAPADEAVGRMAGESTDGAEQETGAERRPR
jgi:hypothetical protein